MVVDHLHLFGLPLETKRKVKEVKEFKKIKIDKNDK